MVFIIQALKYKNQGLEYKIQGLKYKKIVGKTILSVQYRYFISTVLELFTIGCNKSNTFNAVVTAWNETE